MATPPIITILPTNQSVTDAQTLVLSASVAFGTYQIATQFMDPYPYLWTQVSGPACTLLNPTSAVCAVYELSAGTYVFQFTAVDAQANSSSVQTTITVASGGGPIYIPNIDPYVGEQC